MFTLARYAFCDTCLINLLHQNSSSSSADEDDTIPAAAAP